VQYDTATELAPAGKQAPVSRLTGVDASRGLALLGMMAVHVLPGVDPDGDTSAAYLVASGRSAAAFAVLAGVGLALAFGGPRAVNGRWWPGAAVALTVRAVLIGAVGLALGYPDSGVAVILAYYAVLFLLAVPLLRLRSAVLAGIAAAVALVVPVASHLLRADLEAPERANPTFATLLENPGELLLVLGLTGYYPALAWTAYLCAGLAVGRLPLRSPKVAAGLLGGGAALALAAPAMSWLLLGPLAGRGRILATTGADFDPAALDRGWFGATPPTTLWWLALDSPHSSTPLDLLHTTGTALALLGALLLLSRVASRLLIPLAAAGSMTLTLYTVHVVLLSSSLLPAEPTTSYAIQVAAALAVALLWRRWVGRGPLEAVIARASRQARRAMDTG
jgi:uncharacterized membrane protein